LSKLTFIAVWLWLIPTAEYAQCTGSPGVPIFTETFGAGTSTYAPPLPAGETKYSYLGNGCPGVGQYAVVNYTSGCPDWHTLTDHTGNPGGYFMIVGAEQYPLTVYTRTVTGLCPGSTYELSVWMINLNSTPGLILPHVRFDIEPPDTTYFATYDTGQGVPVTNPAQWTKYTFDFTIPAGLSSIVIDILTEYSSQFAPPSVIGGNNFGIDDITFGPVGPSAQIGVNGFPGDTVKSLCNKSTVISSTVGSCYTQNVFQWQKSSDDLTWTDIPGATTSNYSPDSTAAGTEFYRLLVAQQGNLASVNCRTISNTVMIINGTFVPPKFQSLSAEICAGEYTLPSGKQVNTSGVYIDTLLSTSGCDSLISTVNLTVAVKPNLGKDRVICSGETTTLNPGKFSTYKWQDGSTNPVFKVTAGGTYSVTVTDSSGCLQADTVQISDINCSVIPIPNTFTPNGDGINDTWNIPLLQYFPTCTIFIYTRWGRQVFNSIGYSQPWDGTLHGKPLPAGVYYYVINLQNNTPILSGFVTILR